MHSNNRIEFANTLRGLAALSVVASHYLDVFWQYPAIIGQYIRAPVLIVTDHPLPPWLAWGQLFDWGAYGVALFFLISGFVIPFSLQKTSWLGFCLQRLWRIVPTYAAGFSLTLLAFYLSNRYFSSTWRFTLPEILIHYLPGVRDLFDSRNIDTIVWTLEIEMKFYLLCALIIVWLRRYAWQVFLAPVALSALALSLAPSAPQWAQAYPPLLIVLFVPQFIAVMFIGVVFHYLYQQKIKPGIACLTIAGLFLLFCLQLRQIPYFSFVTPDSVWPYAAALLTFGLTYTCPKIFRANPLVDFFADISYPLYVVHSVVGYVGLRILLEEGFSSGMALLSVTALSISLACLLHWLVELPTQRIGKRSGQKRALPQKWGHSSENV